MKKGIQILLVLVMVISILGMSIVGCAKEEAPAAPAAPAVQTYQWRFQTGMPKGDFNAHPITTKFCEIVEKNTDGRITFDIFYAPELTPADEMFDALRDRTFEMGYLISGYLKGMIPTAGIFDGPFCGDWHDLNFLMYELGLDDLYKGELAKFGLVGLSYSGDFKAILSKKPIETLADMQGMKMRSFGIHMDIWTAAGAAPAYIPMSEIYTSLATGVVDAAHTNYGTLYGLKAHELTDYYTTPAMPMGAGSPHVIAQSLLDELPDDLAQIIILSGRESTLWATTMAQITEAYGAVTAKWDKLGLTGTFLTDEAFLNEYRSYAEEAMAKLAEGDPVATEVVRIRSEYYVHKAAGTVFEMVKAKY